MELIAPHLGEKIDSFENEPMIEEFKNQVKKAAEQKSEVEFFCIKGNSYGATFFKEMEPFVSQFASVKKLVLNEIFTQRCEDVVESINSIVRMFSGKAIQALDISNNAVGSDGSKALFEFLKNSTSLKYFWANNCGLAQNGVIHIAKALEEGDIPLRLLSLTRNRIEVKAAEVGKAVATLKELRTLTMFQNGIDEVGFTGLLEGVLQIDNLEKLEINDNWAFGKAFDLLLEVIQKKEKLVELNISDLNLKEDATKRIAQAIKDSNKKWVGFGYDYNDLAEDETAAQLLEALSQSGDSLKWFSIKGNELSDAPEHFDTLKKVSPDVKVQYESEEEDEDEDMEVDPSKEEFKELVDGLKNLTIE